VSVTGIVAALTAEARTLEPLRANPGLRADAQGIRTLPDGNLLIISGMGPQAAARATTALIAAGARNLLSFGLAGGLDPQLPVGAVLLPQAVTDGKGPVHRTDPAWRERLAAGAGADGKSGGTLLSLAQPLTTLAAKSAARDRTQAYAVDMESFAIASVAMQAQLTFAVARVVVDTAADCLPSSVLHATDSHGAVNGPRLLSGLLRNPPQVWALLRLAGRYRIAMGTLRQLGRQPLGAP
jgi:hopanoid-associated phosphorylase